MLVLSQQKAFRVHRDVNTVNVDQLFNSFCSCDVNIQQMIDCGAIFCFFLSNFSQK